jgi:hypothetical protein
MLVVASKLIYETLQSETRIMTGSEKTANCTEQRHGRRGSYKYNLMPLLAYSAIKTAF